MSGVRDIVLVLSAVSKPVKAYWKPLFYLVLMPLLIAISVLSSNLDKILLLMSDNMLMLLVMLSMVGVGILRNWVQMKYSESYANSSFEALFCINLIKSKDFRLLFKNKVEHEQKINVKIDDATLAREIDEVMQKYSPPSVPKFVIAYAILSIIIYCFFFSFASVYILAILNMLASAQLTGNAFLLFLLLFITPLAAVAFALFYLEHTAVVGFREEVVVTEVFTEKESFIGQLLEDNGKYVRLARLEMSEVVGLPDNLASYRVEVTIPNREIKLIKNQFISTNKVTK